MKKFKKIIALLLTVILIFSLAACGKKDKDKTEQAGADAENLTAADVWASLKKAKDYSKGKFDLEFNMSVKDNGEESSAVIKASGVRDGKNWSSGFSTLASAEGQNVDLKAENLVTAADGKLYLDLDSLLKAYFDTDSEIGSYGILLPDFITVNGFDKHLEEIFKAFFVSKPKKDGDALTLTLETAEDYEKGLKASVKYIDENKNAIEECFKQTDPDDLRQYLKDLIDDVSDDVVEAAKLLEIPITDDFIENLKTAVDEMDIAETEVNLFKGFEKIAESVEALTVEDIQKALEGNDMITKLEVTAGESDFSVDFEFTYGEDVKIDFSYAIKGDDSVKVGVPENAASLTEIVQYLVDNPELIQEIGDLTSEDVPDFVPDGDDDEPDYDFGNSNAVELPMEDGKTLVINYDNSVLEGSDVDESMYEVDFLATDGSQSEIDVSIWDSGAEELYEEMMDFYKEYDEDSLLQNGEAVINGLDGFGFQIDTETEGFTEYHYFFDCGENVCAEYDLYYFADSDFSEDEIIGAVTSVAVK